MKTLLVCAIMVCIPWLSTIAQIAINTDGTTPDNSAMLDVKSVSKGVLVPRMTQSQRDNITNPAIGLLIYQTDNTAGYYYNSGPPATPSWKLVGSNAGVFSQWTTSGSNIYYPAGNVGIGTTTPGSLLDVASPSFNAKLGSSSQAVYGEHSISGSYGWIGASNEGGYGYSPNGYGLRGHTINGYALYGEHTDSGNNGWIGSAGEGIYGYSYDGFGVKGNTNLGIAVNGTSTGSGYAGYFSGKTFVSGNLGINETNPNRSLYVSQLVSGLSYPIKVENKHTIENVSAVGILFSAGGSGSNERGKGGLAYTYTSTWNRGSFHFLQNSEANANNPLLSNSVMTITNSGDVGIGTTSPASRLEIVSSSGPNLIIRDTDGGGTRPGIQFKNNQQHFISGDDDGEELFGFYSTFSSARTNDAKLLVYGRAANSWSTFIGMKHDGTNGIIETDAGDIRLMPAGGVAINTSSAGSYKLNINGNVYISGSITTSLKTGSLIIPPAAFTCVNNGYGYYNGGDYLYEDDLIADYAGFMAPVYLPDNATIVSVSSYWMDNTSANAGALYLYRSNFVDGTETEMAENNTTLYGSGTGRLFISDSSISNPVIDTSNYMYYIYLALHGGADVKFYGVKITYTYTSIIE